MKVTIEIDIELPEMDVPLALQEASEHIIGDALRYQAFMAMQSAKQLADYPEGSETYNAVLRNMNSRRAWSEILTKASTNVVAPR